MGARWKKLDMLLPCICLLVCALWSHFGSKNATKKTPQRLIQRNSKIIFDINKSNCSNLLNKFWIWEINFYEINLQMILSLCMPKKFLDKPRRDVDFQFLDYLLHFFCSKLDPCALASFQVFGPHQG